MSLRVSLYAIALFAALAAIVAAFRTEGSVPVAILFSAAFLALPVAAALKPHNYAFSVLALFMFLGFWAKWIALLVLRIPLLEPVGKFDRSVSQWDAALLAASAAAAGALAVRFIEIAWRRRDVTRDAPASALPYWYPRLRVAIWVSLFALLIAATVANYAGAFFQVGVNPLVILPAHLNAVLAWAIHVGIGLAFTIAAAWELHYRRDLGSALAGPVVEALVTSVSTLSRAVFLLRMIPYALVIVDRRATSTNPIPVRRPVLITSATAAAFALSIVAVSAARIVVYPPMVVIDPTQIAEAKPLPPAAVGPVRPPVPRPATDTRPAVNPSVPAGKPGGTPSPALTRSPTLAPRLKTTTAPRTPQPHERVVHTIGSKRELSLRVKHMRRQLSNMVIGRWIGLEGVMAVATADRGPSAFNRVLKEDPNLGLRSSFQQVAGVGYNELDDFTFMTVPGFVAVAAWSGSVPLIALAGALVAFVLIITEAGLRRLRFHAFTIAFTGCVLANAACQMNFPYLALIFLLEMWVALAAIGMFLNVVSRGFLQTALPADSPRSSTSDVG
jgi:hypothetical protein